MSASTARYCSHDADLTVGGSRDPAALAHVDAADVDVHEAPEVSALVEEQVGDRQLSQRVLDRRGVDLEPRLSARLRREERREQDYCHSATSTESTGGKCRAASIQVSPSSGETKTEPLWVPT